MKHFLRFTILLLALLSFNQLSAQDLIYKDKVILKSGSTIVGSVVDYKPGDQLILQLKNGQNITFGDHQIKRLLMYEESDYKEIRITQSLKAGKIYNESEFAFMPGTSALGASISHNVLYQHNWRFSYGVGVSLDNYYMTPGKTLLPIYANGKVNLKNGKNAPFLGVKIGYGLAFENEEENITEAQGGYMANPYFGIRLGSSGLIINLYSGLKFQKVDYVITRNWETRQEDILFRRLVLGMSVMF